MHLTVSGFVTCACFNGSFSLTRETDALDSWASAPITGCPGQTDDAYLKMSFAAGAFGFGITGQDSEPGSGNSDFSPVGSGTCSPLALSGAGPQAGNIEAFCPGVESVHEDIAWSVTD